MKALIIGADSATTEFVIMSIRLRWPESNPQVAVTVEEGLNLAQLDSPDVVLFILDLVAISVSPAVAQIRGLSDAPLVVLGRGEEVMENISSLDLGADDYIRLPCEMTEVMARLGALLRRVGGNTGGGGKGTLTIGGLIINPATFEVALGDRRVPLTAAEFHLLYTLAQNQGVVVRHEALEQLLWRAKDEKPGVLKKHIQRIRTKLGDDARRPRWIASVRGEGYRFPAGVI